MTKKDRRQIVELCALAAKELREAAEGFQLNFDENGTEHISAAMEYIDELRDLLTSSTQAP